MPKVVFPLDSSKKFTEQKIVGHNRWHGDIPAQVDTEFERVLRLQRNWLRLRTIAHVTYFRGKFD
jgi:formamidase